MFIRWRALAAREYVVHGRRSESPLPLLDSNVKIYLTSSMLTLIRKELLTNLLTLRLSIVLVFTVVLSVLTVVIGCLNYTRNMEAYSREVRESGQALEETEHMAR